MHKIDEPNNANHLMPVGALMYFLMPTPPSGWIIANGDLLSRTMYSNLFSVIGTRWGAGDGTTTFSLPDMRGEFIRAWDDGRGVDAGRVFGAAQSDQLQSHTHGYYSATWASGSDFTSSSTGSSYRQTASTGGNETRPRNIALLACIKY